MSRIAGSFFSPSDDIQMRALDHRLKRNKTINSNIANAETPGFRAIGYDFEKQLKAVAGQGDKPSLRTSDPRHLKNAFTRADGSIQPDVYIRPTESVGQDGNTVDTDKEMGELAKNQILYRSAVEFINRKIGKLRYAINGGR